MIKQQLKTFLTVCETHSFSRAAGALFITPSAVIQQINTLEDDLGVTLFVRGPRGVELTFCGEYLLSKGEQLIRLNEEIRTGIARMSSSGKEICVGTSLLEKCRLLYNLWILFSEENKGFEITMVNIDTGHLVPERADLVESVNGGVPWTKEWEFLKICDVPFGFAFRQDHPLSKKAVITLDDLKNERVTSINRGTSEAILDMLCTLEGSGIVITYQETPGTSPLWESAFKNEVLVVPMCWGDILINMALRPCRWDKAVPYGIFYRPQPSPASAEFLKFIRDTYADMDLSDIFPSFR